MSSSSSLMKMMNEEEEKRIIYHLKSFPPGWRFKPSAEELIVGYLKKKIQDAPLPINLIKDVHLYDHNPWDLTENSTTYGGNEFYFFTLKDRKYAIGSLENINVAGIGYWMPNEQEEPVYDSNGVEIGFKRRFVFYKGKAPNGEKTSWVMHEYKAKDEDAESTSTHGTTANVRAATTVVTKSVNGGDMQQLDEWVLCKIYKMAEKESAAAPLPAASPNNHLNIIENTATRVENTATREGNTSRNIFLGNEMHYDRDKCLLWRSNKCIGKVFDRTEEPAATPSVAAENHLNIIENTITRLEDTAIREENSTRYIYITSDTCYDPDTFLLWRLNKCLGNIFKSAEQELQQQHQQHHLQNTEERNDDAEQEQQQHHQHHLQNTEERNDDAVIMFNIEDYLLIPADIESSELLDP